MTKVRGGSSHLPLHISDALSGHCELSRKSSMGVQNDIAVEEMGIIVPDQQVEAPALHQSKLYLCHFWCATTSRMSLRHLMESHHLL